MIKEILNEKGLFNMNNNDNPFHLLKVEAERLSDILLVNEKIKDSDWKAIKKIVSDIDKNINSYK